MKWLVLMLLVSACGGVSKTALTEDGKKVVVMTTNRDTGCDVLDKVVGLNEIGSTELAKNHARNLAGDKDANAIFFDEVVPNGNTVKVFATAYKCP